MGSPEVEILLKVSKFEYEMEALVDPALRVDFFLPNLRAVLEVNGSHHYLPKR